MGRLLATLLAALAIACGPAAVESASPPSSVGSAGVATSANGACHFGDVARCSAACDEGHPRACNNLGAAYEEGAGVVRDLDRALALYVRACQGGAHAGCTNQSRLAAARGQSAAPADATAIQPPPPPPPPPAVAGGTTVTTSSTSTTSSPTVVMQSETCTVNGQAVSCANLKVPGMSIVKGPDGGLTISVHGIHVYTDPTAP